jgi:two-component system chemotaxis sensor kinase CheA
MNFDRSRFIGKFTQEAKELIQKLNDGLIELEKDPERHGAIKEIMRVAHTLKGSSKIMRFNKVSSLAHKMEDLLIGVQEGHLKLTGEILDLLFKSTDLVSQCVESILKGEGDSVEITLVCEVLDRATRGEDISVMVSELLSKEQPFSSAEIPSSLGAREHKNTHMGVQSVSPSVPSPALSLSENKFKGDEMISSWPSISEKSRSKPKVEETIRIGVDKLDNAVRLVSEIAVSHRKSDHNLSVLKDLYRIARKHAKQIQQVFQGNSSGIRKEVKTELISDSLQMLRGLEEVFKESRDEMAMLEIVLNELYEDVLKMRMLPLSTVFDTFPRAVRDMAKHFKKEIELRIMGEETMLDKKIIEKLNGPLIHLLRNCIDHGIETPEERIAQGKPATGIISISAYQKSGRIELIVTDDGRGVQTEKLKQRIIKRGLVTEEQAQKLGEAELVNMVFLPGVSTSNIITDISGRGLGMEIVKADIIEQLKGSVSFSSRQGQGTCCVLTLPMTLTTLRSLIITSQNKLFAVPINSIEETLQMPSHEFVGIMGHTAIRLRNQIIYTVDLADVLELSKKSLLPREQNFILVVRASGKRVGLLVDEILDEQDVVVKQLPTHMQKVKTIAGATISSNNTIIPILHIPEIVEFVKRTPVKHQEEEQISQEMPLPRILVVEDSVNTGEIEKGILEAYGYKVDLAKDGVDALEHLEKTTYSLIVTDIEMPRMDGFTLTEQLRSIPQYADIPIIMVTSLERESEKKRGIQVGADAYILKSTFEQKSLIETVRSLIRG